MAGITQEGPLTYALHVTNPMQQTHALFGKLAHYGSEPFEYPIAVNVSCLAHLL